MDPFAKRGPASKRPMRRALTPANKRWRWRKREREISLKDDVGWRSWRQMTGTLTHRQDGTQGGMETMETMEIDCKVSHQLKNLSEVSRRLPESERRMQDKILRLILSGSRGAGLAMGLAANTGEGVEAVDVEAAAAVKDEDGGLIILPLSLSLSLRACFAHLTSLQWLTARKSTKQRTAWYDHLQTPVPPPTGSSRPLLGYSGPFPCSPLLNCIDNSLTGHSRSQETLSLLLSGKPVQQGHRSPTDSQTASYKLPPNERISLKCRACLSASLFLKGGKEAGHRGEEVEESLRSLELEIVGDVGALTLRRGTHREIGMHMRQVSRERGVLEYDWLSDKHCKFGRIRDAGAILSCRLLRVDVTTFRLYTREVSAGGRWQAHTGFITS
ncbi:hypothetical protein DPX16_13676 [Anabarilius grahami]|uniref:Uncharacterized protein n=1 Tax=Anabarilius grahami TaxID=495550 RepID=A0A3N0XRS4_ANAGA|nr:hypothetical protein DPX16_13676 [Anabarilius grahami]